MNLTPDHPPMLDELLCFALYSTSLVMSKAYRPLLTKLGITYPQYLVLIVLWRQDQMTVSEIGKQLYLDSSTLTPLLKRMALADLIRRNRSERDERQVEVSLTEAGSAMRKEAASIMSSMQCALQCTQEELQALNGTLASLRSNLEKRF